MPPTATGNANRAVPISARKALLSWSAPSIAGRKLAAIEIRGLSGEFARDLRFRVPVREGDVLTDASIETTEAMVKRVDGHLEVRFDHEPEGAVPRIQSPGAPEAPIVSFK